MKRNETSLAAIQHFVSDSSHIHCTVLDMRTYTYMLASHQRALRCAQHVAMPTVILNIREENFCDHKSNHEIHESIVPRNFGAILSNRPCTTPCQGSMTFFELSKACFLKHLEQFCFTLLLYTARMVWMMMMPQFSFWHQSYLFAPNSKSQSATKYREIHEQDELSQRKYSRRRLFGQGIASLVAKA